MIGVRRRLFWKVYLTLLSSLIAVTALMGAFWWLVGERATEGWRAPEIRLDDRMLPAPGGPPAALAAATERLADEMNADVSVYSADGKLAASRGSPIGLAASERERFGRMPRVMRIDLADGRVVLAQWRPPGPRPGLRILSIVLIVAGGVGLTAFPVAARLTRRLEALRSGVERWGAGGLSLRVDDAGRRRSRGCRAHIQRRRRAHRATPERAEGAARQRQPRGSLATGAAAGGGRALARRSAPRPACRDPPRSRRERATRRRDPAREPPRPRRRHHCAQRSRRSVGPRGRGGGAPRGRASRAFRKAASRSRSKATRRCCAA